MPIVVMGAGLPSVIREDEGGPGLEQRLEEVGLRVVLSTEPPSQPELVRKRRRGGSAET